MIRYNETDYVTSVFPPTYLRPQIREKEEDKAIPPKSVKSDKKSLPKNVKNDTKNKKINIHDTRFKC